MCQIVTMNYARMFIKFSLDGDLKQKAVYDAEQLNTRGEILEDDVEVACSSEVRRFGGGFFMKFVPACGKMRRRHIRDDAVCLM